MEIESQSELVESGLSREMEWEGVRLSIQIYRLASSRNWTLEVINEAGTSTVWDEQFATDRAADAVFRDTLAREGIQAFLEDGEELPFSGRLH